MFNDYPHTDLHELNLDWVIKKVKELATAWAQVQQDWTDEQAAFANLQSWIENYFNNLDVQTEINVKIDSMVVAGTMSELIAPYVASGLPAEVADQIGDVVAAQIGPVVAAQISAVVADQLPAVAAAAAAQEVSAWLALHVNPDTGYVIDDTFTIQGAAADAKAVGDEFTAIKSALTENKNVIFTNFDNLCPLLRQNARIQPALGIWKIEPSDVCLIRKVNAGDHIFVKPNGINSAQWAYLSTFDFPVAEVSANIAGYSGSGNYVRSTNGANETLDEYIPNETNYLYICLVDNNGNNRTPNEMRINGVPYNLNKPQLFDSAHKSLTAETKGWHFESRNLSFTNGETKKFDFKQCVRKNAILCFSGTISSFTSITVGYIGMNEYGTDLTGYDGKVVVDATSVTVSVKKYDGTYNDTTYTHGLTIANELQVFIIGDATNKAKIKIASCGQEYECETTWEMYHFYYPFVTATNCMIADGVLSFTSEDIRKKIWVFGDSYIRYVNTRWAYWLHEMGYDKNVLINGHGGAHSIDESIESLKTLLSIAVPKYVLWCLGMNDTPDTSTTLSPNWEKGKNALIDLSEQYGFTPVFTTIPNVPDRNHDLKNAWIRSSGYQYVDFAKAVGADEDGIWYYGLRENERTTGDIGRHPSELGAKVLCNEVIVEFSQITCDC